MIKTIAVKLVGVCPILMHNGQAADPLNKFAKQLSTLSGKKKKTEADHIALAEIEFFAGLYLKGDSYILPGVNIESMLSKKAFAAIGVSKADMLSGVFIDDDFILDSYSGPRDPRERQLDKNCYDRRLVKVSTARIARTRPKFQQWSATGEINYDDSVVDASKLMHLLIVCGQSVGIGDYRPKFGRFTVE